MTSTSSPIEPQRHPVAVAVEFEHLDLDGVADRDHLGRMLDPPPRHVGDVQQAVDAAQIQKRAVIGEVLDHALDDLAFLEVLQQRLAFGAVFLFDHGPAGNHHVVAAAVELDDLEFLFLAFEIAGVAHRAHVHQRAGQEGADFADIDRKAALDLAADQALDDLFFLERLLQGAPDAGALGFFTGQPGFSGAVFKRVQGDFDFIAHFHIEHTFLVVKLFERNQPFRLQAGVDHHPIRADGDHKALDDGARLHLLVSQALFKQFGETFTHGL